MTLNVRAVRMLTVVLASVMLLGCLYGCSDQVKPVESSEQDMRVVGKCDAYEIRYEELRFVTTTYKKTLEQKYGTGIWDDPTTAEKHRAELEELVGAQSEKVRHTMISGKKHAENQEIVQV